MQKSSDLKPHEITVIEKIADTVKEKMLGEGSGHDWWHIYRVWHNAIAIAEKENADMFIVQLAALLHDIDDWKFNDGDTKAGGRTAYRLLDELSVDQSVCKNIAEIIDNLSFKGAGVKSTMTSLEGKIVQDADRLESMGAMGIARTFAYGGFKGRPLYDPTIAPEVHETFEQYKNSNGPSINHFYEKLLLVKDMMNTDSARKLAEGRHEFMETFLKQFFAEWQGEA